MLLYSSLAVFLSFFVTLKLLPSWIARANRAGLVGKDINKLAKPKVAELGGLPVLCGFLAGSLVFVAIVVFIYNNTSFLHKLFAALVSILIAAIIGIVDDILGWKIGLRQRHKVLLSFAIPLPIMVINAGTSAMFFPFLGLVDLGLLYPLLVIPIGIIGASNAFNMLAGYNGLEAGMGIIILSVLSFFAYVTGSAWVAIVGLCMVASLIAFLIYNFYPAKIFPGDTLTYTIGTMVAIVAILGNLEMFALILFLPYFLEFFLKARGKMKKESFAKPVKDGSIVNLYNKWYSLKHIIISFLIKIKNKAFEWEVPVVMYFIEIILSIFTIIYYYYF